MWILVGIVFLVYVLGLVLICLSNDRRNEAEDDVELDSPSTNVDNNSLSASSNSITRGNNRSNNQGECIDDSNRMASLYHHQFPSPEAHQHHRLLLQRYYQRLFFNRLVSSNFRCDDHEEDEPRQGRTFNTSLESSSSTSASASPSPNPDPTRSSLFAYRQQQLRQIHHEINEMSYLLGASQHSQSDDRNSPNSGNSGNGRRSFPLPIFGRSSMVVQPLWRQSSSSNNASPYSFVYEPASPSTMTSGVVSDSARRDSCIGSTGGSGSCGVNTSNNGNAAGGGSSTSTSSNIVPGGDTACLSTNSLSYSPNTSESCHIVRERQRRLRHIRMELEGLSLQLNNADSGGGCGETTIRSSNFSPLIYFDGGGGDGGYTNDEVTTRALINVHGRSNWSPLDDEDDLPGYESIVCYSASDAAERVAATSSSEEKVEDTPPPSYSEAVHLYSFSELEERRK